MLIPLVLIVDEQLDEDEGEADADAEGDERLLAFAELIIKSLVESEDERD